MDMTKVIEQLRAFVEAAQELLRQVDEREGLEMVTIRIPARRAGAGGLKLLQADLVVGINKKAAYGDAFTGRRLRPGLLTTLPAGSLIMLRGGGTIVDDWTATLHVVDRAAACGLRMVARTKNWPTDYRTLRDAAETIMKERTT